MYTKGLKGKSYFKTGGNTIENNSIVTITENGDYTFYSKDGVGNEQVYTVKVENIDTTPPAIEITDNSNKLGLSTTVSINYGDSTTKKYKIGNGNWTNYTSDITITSDTVISNNLGNSDGTVTICAQGVDSVGNTKEVCDKILTLDIDAPTTPVINSNAGYPVLTEYGVAINGKTTISYDTRKDIDNYYSSDGTNWTKYNGEFNQTSGTIYAKSVKKNSGLTVQTSKTIGIPGDALGAAAYDGDTGTKYISRTSRTVNKYLMISPDAIGKTLKVIHTKSSDASLTAIFYDNENNVISSIVLGKYSTKDTVGPSEITIPNNARKINFQIYQRNDYWNIGINEVYLINEPTINVENIYPTLTNYGVEESYAKAKISYFETSIQRLYSFDNENWMTYPDKEIKMELGKTVYAKGIDKYGKETTVVSYTSQLLTDTLGPNAYDGNNSTYDATAAGTKNRYLLIAPETIGKKLKVSYEASVQTALYAIFYDVNGNVIQKTTLVPYDNYGSGVKEVTIPANTYKVNLQSTQNQSYWEMKVREVYVQ